MFGLDVDICNDCMTCALSGLCRDRDLKPRVVYKEDE